LPYRSGRAATRFSLSLVLLFGVAFAEEAHQDSKIGLPIDWSSRHVLHSNALPPDAATNGDPRAVYDWLLRKHASQQTAAALTINSGKLVPKKAKSKVTVDWNFPLGAGTVAVGMFPAKYSFDAGSSTLTAANCTSDYLVYGLNIQGGSTQPNLVRFNNIYAGAGGLCGANPTVLSAYTINTLDNGGTNPLNGVIESSPALSLDGKKLAFIETVTGNSLTCPGLGSNSTCSIFHVLTWGTSGNNGSFDTTNNVYAAIAPTNGNDASITTLTFSASTATYSSPWIDYRATADNAYFGDDSGKLYKTTCAFYCTTAPQLVSGWPITVVPGVTLGPPVYDTVSNKIFVGGSNGNLYLIDLLQCPGVTCNPIAGGIKTVVVGSPNPFGAVLDAPIVDPTFQTVFAFAGNNGSGKGVAAQTNTSFTGTVLKLLMGSSAFFNIYAGAVDNAYYQNTVGGATVSGNLFACGQLGGSGQPDLYWAPFTKGAGNLSTANPPVLNIAGAKNKNIPGNPGVGCSPLTEFQNGATDRLFFSQSSLPAGKCVTGSAANDGCMMMYDITTPSTTIGASPNAAAEENFGTSAIIVDNASPSVQASSVYFANQGTATCTTGVGTPSYCAIKLTQSLLQ
jgi:hypothetical protein